MARKRNQFVDIMRGIAMLLVVLGHTMMGCTTGAEESFIYNIVWTLQMPLFILISGYVTRYSRRIFDAADLWSYVKRRTIAYLLPWGVWSLFVRGIIFGESSFLNIKWLLWHMDSGYWFLATIWTISIIFGICTFIAKKKARDSEIKQQAFTLILYVVAMSILVGVGKVTGLSFFAIKLTLYYMPFYFVGYIYGQYRDRILKHKFGETALDVVVVVCLVAWLLLLNRFYIYALPDSGMAILLRIVSSITGCIAICGLCKGVFEVAPISFFSGYSENSDLYIRDLSDSQLTPDSIENIGNNVLLDSSEKETCIKQFNINYGTGNTDHIVAGTDLVDQFDYNRIIAFKALVGALLQWCGVHSLEIYLTHYLMLCLLKINKVPIADSIQGTALIVCNYIISVTLTFLVVKLINSNKVLRLVLYGS